MHLLETTTITLAALMVGAEVSVAAFVNPAAAQLHQAAQAQVLSALARSLGRVMPVWYGLCLVLFAIETILHRGQPAFVPLVTATLIWAAMIVFSITMLVPINNRIAALNPAAPTPGWKQQHTRWDFLHRIRTSLLLIAVIALTHALAA